MQPWCPAFLPRARAPTRAPPPPGRAPPQHPGAHPPRAGAGGRLSAPQNERADAVLRLERMNVRMAGVRAKRAAEAAQAEKDA